MIKSKLLNKQETMTVKELIEELKKYNPNLPVIIEGCDCLGNCFYVKKEYSEYDKETYLVIERSP